MFSTPVAAEAQETAKAPGEVQARVVPAPSLTWFSVPGSTVAFCSTSGCLLHPGHNGRCVVIRD